MKNKKPNLSNGVFFMKKALVIIISIFLILPIISVNAETHADIKTYGVLSYKVENKEITITDCKSKAEGEVIIPETIDGLPVTAIYKETFASCKLITGVTIPNTVKTIGSHAFTSCKALKILSFPIVL